MCRLYIKSILVDPLYNFHFYSWGDVDNSPTEEELMKLKYVDRNPLFELSFGKRPEFELYDVKQDPFHLNNLANDSYKAGL